jgi:hypothetical protein
MDPPYDPATPLLGVYPMEMRLTCGGHICTPVVIAALLRIAKMQNQHTSEDQGFVQVLQRSRVNGINTEVHNSNNRVYIIYIYIQHK